MAQVRILWDDSVSAFRVSTPYNPKFVDLLKQLIPAGERKWDPQTKIWTVEEKYGLPMLNLCDTIWGKGASQYVDRAQMATSQAAAQAAWAQQQATQQTSYQYVPPKPVQSNDPLDSVLLNFIKLLPYEAAQAAYRKAAMVHHPDRNNGDGSKMTALNQTWKRIEDEFYRKGVQP